MGKRNKRNIIARRIRRKRNWLVHLMIFTAISSFFMLLNIFTYNQYDGWWFMFIIIPLFLLLCFHYIFTIGRDHMETVAIRWEENELGIPLHIENSSELEDDLLRLRENLELPELEKRHPDERELV